MRSSVKHICARTRTATITAAPLPTQWPRVTRAAARSHSSRRLADCSQRTPTTQHCQRRRRRRRRHQQQQPPTTTEADDDVRAVRVWTVEPPPSNSLGLKGSTPPPPPSLPVGSSLTLAAVAWRACSAAARLATMSGLAVPAAEATSAATAAARCGRPREVVGTTT
jgi:hypothetical protein